MAAPTSSAPTTGSVPVRTTPFAASDANTSAGWPSKPPRAPSHRPDSGAVCAVCGDPQLVAADQPTALCETHAFEPGELVADRETGSLLVVVEPTAARADESWIGDDQRIADVASNRNYGSHEPVIEAVYVSGLGRPTRRYGFPASRLRKTDDGLARGQRLLASHQSASPATAVAE